jgi:diacylglycerol kinase family enzyme
MSEIAPVEEETPCPVLVNPRAGRRGVDAGPRVQAACEKEGVAVEIRSVEPEALSGEIDRLVGLGSPVVGVSGGDGSLATAAARLAGTTTALLPIPTGTLNHFARRLGIARPEDAATALSGGRVATAPVGVVDDRVFLNTATFGVYADVVRRRESLRRLLTKWPAAIVAFWGVLLRMRRLELVLHVEGKHLRRTTPVVWVGIGWGSFPRVLNAAERRKHPDLEIVVLRPGGRLGAATLLGRLIVHLLRGDERPIDDPALEVIHARSLLIHSPHRIGVTMDGEVMRFEPPLYVAVQDEALRVVTRKPTD